MTASGSCAERNVDGRGCERATASKNRRSTSSGTSAKKNGASDIQNPGMARARSRITARNATRATSSTGTLTKSGACLRSGSPWRPATIWNSVSTGPGQRCVTLMPVPRSSARRPSEKRTDVGLGRGVDGEVGQGQEAGDAADVEDGAGPVAAQGGHELVAERGQRHDVDLEHALDLGAVACLERPRNRRSPRC